MIPGMNPKKMEQAMKKLGIAQQELDAHEIIIKCSDKEIIIKNPQVSRVNMMGQMTYQISGDEEEITKETTPEINDDDIKTVMEQANVNETTAKEALAITKGDIAEAIMGLKE